MKITFRAARVNRGLTQSEAAKLMDVNVVTIIRWEKGTVIPSLANIKLMSEIYNCPEELFVVSKKST